MVYFAYGTLLDIEGMRKYCPKAKPIGVMRLPDYKLSFARYGKGDSEGGCTLEKVPGHFLCGVLYDVTSEELKALDSASGIDKGYWAKLDIMLINERGEKVPANTYVIPKPVGSYKPPASYTRPILVGAKAFKMPPEYIVELEKIIESAGSK